MPVVLFLCFGGTMTPRALRYFYLLILPTTLLISGIVLAQKPSVPKEPQKPAVKTVPSKQNKPLPPSSTPAKSTLTLTFSKDVKRIMAQRCVVCHNATTVKNIGVSGGLALDTFAATMQGVVGTPTRPILVAGKSAESELYKRLILKGGAKLMPKGGPPIPPNEIAIVKNWIDLGAAGGDASKDTKEITASPESLPMPGVKGTTAVWFTTRIEIPAHLRTKDIPANAPPNYTLRVGPLPAITALAFSPDGKTLAVGGYRSVMFWDMATGTPQKSITHLPGAVFALVYRPDGQQLAVGGGAAGLSGEVRIYDVKSLTPVGKPIAGHTDVVLSLAWNGDGTRIATASQDKTARLWEIATGKELFVFKEHSDAVTRVVFSPDSKFLYTASLDRSARRFELEKGTQVRVFTGHNEAINALAINAAGNRIITSGVESTIRWWDTENGNTVVNHGGHGISVNEIVVSKDGSLLASASGDKTVRLWDAGSTGHKAEFRGATDWVYTVAISPDKRLLVGAGAEGILYLWDASNSRLRLGLMMWSPTQNGATPEWLAITPEGYFDGSKTWAEKVGLALGTVTITAKDALDALKTFRSAESVLKAWTLAELAPAKIPALPPPPEKK